MRILGSVFRRALAVGLAAWLLGCSAVGGRDAGGALARDAAALPVGDLAGPGPQAVVSARVAVRDGDGSLEVVVYRPVAGSAKVPGVVFLPGRMATDDQYESYARGLASRGLVVAVRGWYSLFASDAELARDARRIAEWLVREQGVDAARIGVAGHSMGGKDAVLAAAQYGSFAGVVAIDPDDNGRVSVVRGALAGLRAPLLLIGAELAWQAASVCAPVETNYQRFFERAPAGTVELTLRGADHVQMLDDPDRFGYGICRCGTADSRQVRIVARRAVVGFFVQHLLGGVAGVGAAPGLATVRVAGAGL